LGSEEMKKINNTPLLILLLSAILLTVGCGGGGSTPLVIPSKEDDNQSNSVQPVGSSFRTLSDSEIGVFSRVRISDGSIGIGPAFQHERPELGDLDTRTSQHGITVGSGRWHDPSRRDGSASAETIVDFLVSFQIQSERETRENGDLIVGDYGQQRTLRIGDDISQLERKLIIRAIENLNSALSYENRLQLGKDVTEFLLPEEIPNGEIHIHITNGKGKWFDNSEEYKFENPERILGIGGVGIDQNTEMLRALKGYAWIDRNAINTLIPLDYRYSAYLEFVITHELLHAYGIGAHADPNKYRSSLLVPELPRDLRVVPPLFTSLDGEGLLAIHKISPGTPVRSLSSGDLGPWENDGFQLVARMDKPDNGGADFEFGATFRNGLAKPWAIGPRPNTSIRNNTELLGMDRATWNGSLIGFTRRGQTASGNTRIMIDLGNFTGQAKFEGIETWGNSVHPGTRGKGQVWQDGDLNYRIAVPNNGSAERFISISAPNDDPGKVIGVFTGARHEGATGIVEHPGLSAAFGAVR